MNTEYVFDKATVRGTNVFTPLPGIKSTFSIKTRSGKTVKITTLTREQALNSCKVNGKLLITKATVLPDKERVQLLSLGNPAFDYILYPSKQGFKTQTIEVGTVKPEFSFKRWGRVV